MIKTNSMVWKETIATNMRILGMAYSRKDESLYASIFDFAVETLKDILTTWASAKYPSSVKDGKISIEQSLEYLRNEIRGYAVVKAVIDLHDSIVSVDDSSASMKDFTEAMVLLAFDAIDYMVVYYNRTTTGQGAWITSNKMKSLYTTK